VKTYALALSLLTLVSAPAQASIVLYSNDFQSGVATGWSGDVTSVATAPSLAPDGSAHKFLGLFNRKGTSQFDPIGVPVFSTLNVATSGFSNVTVSFDLYTLDGLDGDNFFSFDAGGTSFLNASFSNVFPYPQTYGGPSSAPGTGSDPTAVDRFGYPFGFGDRTYRMSYVVPISAASTTFRLGGKSGTYGGGAFGVDNFKVVAMSVGAVPEPTTWAMMLFGFGLIGGALRFDRRRKLSLVTAS
jgi:hypothetical protein